MKKLILILSATLAVQAYANFTTFKGKDPELYYKWSKYYSEKIKPNEPNKNYLPFDNEKFSNTDLLYWRNNIQTNDYALAKNGRYYPLQQRYAYLFNDKSTTVGVIDSGYSGDELEVGGTVYGLYSYNNNSREKYIHRHGDITVGTMTGINNEGIQYPAPLANATVYFWGGDKLRDVSKDDEAIRSRLFYETAVDKGVKIWNNSYVNYYNIDKNGETYLTQYGTKDYESNYNTYFQRFKTQEEFIQNNDLLFIYSAGNEDQLQPAPNALYPLIRKRHSMLDGWLIVGAYDEKTNKIWEESNYCGDAKDYCLVANAKVAVASTPNSSSYKDGTRYVESTGTSVSAPYVTSLAVTLKSMYPFLTNKQLKMAILTNAKDIGMRGIDDTYGWGLMDFDKSLKMQSVFNDDVVFNLAHDKHKAVEKNVYTFGNVLTGKGNITVKNATKKEIVNFNREGDIKGKLTVDNADINIDGKYPQMPVEVKSNGTLHGQGYIKSLVSDGRFYNYSYFARNEKEEVKTPMLVDDGITLKDNSTLFVAVGSPLRAKGEIQVAGTLVIDGDLPNNIDRMKIAISGKAIKGEFEEVKIIGYLNKYRIVYSDKEIYLEKE